MNSVTFTVLPPPKALMRDVECIRIAVHTGMNRALEVKVCPSGLPGLVFGLSADGLSAIESIATQQHTITDIPIVFLHGQGATPSSMRFRQGPYKTIQVVLKPHALYSIFGLNADTINEGFLTPEAFGLPALTAQLLTAHGDAERINLICSGLTNRLTTSTTRDELVEKALEIIHNNIHDITVKDVLDHFHISERQFQKRFSKVVGMTAQLYIRIKRINEALRLMSTGECERLSDIAHALNFYDQSHFIREIKTFSWITPKDITQKVNEFHQDIAGASYV